MESVNLLIAAPPGPSLKLVGISYIKADVTLHPVCSLAMN